MSGSDPATFSSLTHSARKKRRILERLMTLPSQTAVLFEDETDLRLFPPLRAGWARQGELFETRISGSNAKRVVFGSLNVRTGHRVLLAQPHGRAENFCAFLHHLRGRYRRWPVVLLLDEDRSHTANASEILAAALKFELIWLPTRSPELNGLEALWGDGKDHVCANRQYETIHQETEQFLEYLYGLMPRDALRKAGLLSEEFWLHPIVSKDFWRPA